jgi:hypothetical protein
LNLWVELKFVRQRRDVRIITEDIAADLVKYGDNERRTLFVVYDPARHVTDEHEFAEPIVRRPGMFVQFIR